MKTPLWLLCVAVLPALVHAQVESDPNVTPRAFLHQWSQSLLVGDLDATVAYYEQSKDVVAVQSTGHVWKGSPEIRKGYVAAFQEVVFRKVSLESLSVRQRGDVAWATCEFKANTLRQMDQTEWILHVRSSFVLERSENTWKIVLEHFSPMADVPRVRRRL